MNDSIHRTTSIKLSGDPAQLRVANNQLVIGIAPTGLQTLPQAIWRRIQRTEIIALAMMAFGAIILYLFISTTQIDCEKDTPTARAACEVRHTRLWHKPEVTLPRTLIHSAAISNESDVCYLKLIMAQQHMTIKDYPCGVNGHAFYLFLNPQYQSQAASLRADFTIRNALAFCGLGSILLFFGMLLLLSSLHMGRLKRITVDRKQQQVDMEYAGIFGDKHRKYTFGAIKQVVYQGKDSDKSQGIHFELGRGKIVMLHLSGNEDDLQQWAHTLTRWISGEEK